MDVLSRVIVTLKPSEIPVDGEEDRDPYGGLSQVNADIALDTKANKIGSISAILVDRQAIPDNCFHEVFDEHSGDLDFVGSSLLENHHGRTRLASLVSHDDPEFNFMYITDFELTKNVDSDVAAAALYKFLHEPTTIKGNLPYGCWLVSSAAFTVWTDPDMDTAGDKKRKRSSNGNEENPREVAARKVAEPFLRNGFFQDQALVREDTDKQRILVASYEHWDQPIRPMSQVPKLNFYAKAPRAIAGPNRGILNAVRRVVVKNPYESINLAAIMAGQQQYKPPSDPASEKDVTSLRAELKRLLQGSDCSISASTALPEACENNSLGVVKLLLELDLRAINSKDLYGRTPLMMAAKNATGRLSINGIDDTAVIDFLLAKGADKALVDSTGMTAYGHFTKASKPYAAITHPSCRGKLVALESKLCPPAGPTMVDLSSGKGGQTGFVDYRSEDEEADREMGLGRYDDDPDEGDY